MDPLTPPRSPSTDEPRTCSTCGAVLTERKGGRKDTQMCGVCRARAALAFDERARQDRRQYTRRRRREAAREEGPPEGEGGTGTGKIAAG
jgi:uncharacterized Zn finger protein (UPF0148 family)